MFDSSPIKHISFLFTLVNSYHPSFSTTINNKIHSTLLILAVCREGISNENCKKDHEFLCSINGNSVSVESGG